MFEIEYKGGNGIILSTKKGSLIVDPKLSLIGLKDLKVKDEVELATEKRFCLDTSDAKLVVEGPGEYGVGEFAIRGVSATRHIDTQDQPQLSTVYRIECGDTRVAIIGNIDPKLSEEQLESIGVIDLLIIPVGGGGYTLDATSASTLVRAIDPKAVVPVHYADAALRYEVPQDEIDVFIAELGAPVEETTKLKIKSASSLPQVLTVIKVARS